VSVIKSNIKKSGTISAKAISANVEISASVNSPDFDGRVVLHQNDDNHVSSVKHERVIFAKSADLNPTSFSQLTDFDASGLTAGSILVYDGTKFTTNNTLQDVTQTWEHLISAWSYEPTFNSYLSSGDVYEYVYSDKTMYRFVPAPYTTDQDAFYLNFDGAILSGFVVSRS
jgi:hypothetical protein